jgi:hypothetical protein
MIRIAAGTMHVTSDSLQHFIAGSSATMSRKIMFARIALISCIAFVATTTLGAATADKPATGEWPSPVTWKPDPRAVKSGLYIEPKQAVKKASVPFTVKEPDGIARKHWPVRGSIPLFRGELADAAHVRLVDSKGTEVPVQAIATAFWPEKTVRFLCLDFLTDLAANEEATFTVEYGSEVSKFNDKAMVKSEKGGCEIATANNIYIFTVAPAFLQVRNDKAKRTVGPITGEVRVAKDEKGASAQTMPLTVEKIEIIERGPVQTTVHVVGHYGDQKSAITDWSMDKGYLPTFRGATMSHDYWRYPVSLHFRIYQNSDQVYLEHCFGYNGNEYADFVQSYSLKIPTGMKDGSFVYGPDDTKQATAPLGVRLNQTAHDKWTLTGKAQAEGRRFGGWGAITTKGWTVGAALRDGWQNWPAAIRADENGDLVCELFGEKPDAALDLRYKNPDGTFHKSHSMYNGEKIDTYYTNVDAHGRAAGLCKIQEVLLTFSSEEQKLSEVARAHQKLLLPWPGSKRYKDTRAMGLVSVFENDRWDHIRQYYKIFLSIMPVFHEANGIYGWVDWGDVPMIDGAKDGKFVLDLGGAYGWSNGERALCTFFYQYIATGERFFIDTGRPMVHHCMGIDTEHEGGDYPHGSYARHDQAHWREWDPIECRQGGYRGWHNWAWLTGDPEVRRLAISAGIDAASNRRNMDVADPNEAVLKIADNMTANHLLATMCWISTGNSRYARAHHAISQATEHYASLGQQIPYLYELHVPKSGEIDVNTLPPSVSGGQSGYWYTYGGDDLLLDWIMLTGDTSAVNALLQEGRTTVPGIGNYALYHQPEALLLGIAYLEPTNPGILNALNHRLTLVPALHYFARDKLKAPASYANANDWERHSVAYYQKNGWSIFGCMAQEALHIMAAIEHLESKPAPLLSIPLLQLPPIVSAREGKDTALLEIDGSKTIGTPDEIKDYTWFVNGKQVATGPNAKLEVPVGPVIVKLLLTAKDGLKLQSQRALNVLPSGEWKYSFGGGPGGFLDGNTNFNESLGYGWSNPEIPWNAYTTNAPYNDPEHNQGCGFLCLWRTVDFLIKVPAGEYTLEMGAGAKSDFKLIPPTGINGVAIEAKPGSAPFSWTWTGPAKPDDKGLIHVNFVRNGESYPGISYMIVRKKK